MKLDKSELKADRNALALVFDSETTGTKEPMAIIEAAYLELDEQFNVVGEFRQLYDPGMPISFGTMSAHHIMQSEVDGQQPAAEFVLPDAKYVIGHKVDFDMDAIKYKGDIKRICTLAIARKHLPEVDSHTQSALMYYFEGPSARERLRGAHSALVDVQNCYRLLGHLQNVMDTKGIPTDTLEQLWAESERCRIPDIFDFGKHKGEKIADVPWSYRSWCMKQADMDPYLHKAIMATL